MRILLAGAIFLSALSAAGCAASSANRAAAENAAYSAGFRSAEIQTRRFKIFSYARLLERGKPLTVYIEGDGRAWLDRGVLSNNPTPKHPLALQLATLDSAPNVVYLARPCQYVDDPACGKTYWSDKRFSEEVIASMNDAVSHFASENGSQKIRLVGYSGGGAVAVLVAARRQDVTGLWTVAGNLDPNGVNALHHVTPLAGSLDPMEAAKAIAGVRQVHFTGRRDSVVPPSIARAFQEASGSGADIRIVEADATHQEGWAESWRERLKNAPDA